LYALGDRGGVIAYAIGTPASSSHREPGLWVEQGKFLIRKLRLPSQIEVVAEKYERYKKKLWFPKLREVHWDNHKAQIKVYSVSSIKNNSKNKKKLSTDIFDVSKNPQQVLKLPDDVLIQEFYSRFR